jgi:hypothetical protein
MRQILEAWWYSGISGLVLKRFPARISAELPDILTGVFGFPLSLQVNSGFVPYWTTVLPFKAPIHHLSVILYRCYMVRDTNSFLKWTIQWVCGINFIYPENMYILEIKAFILSVCGTDWKWMVMMTTVLSTRRPCHAFAFASNIHSSFDSQTQHAKP